MIGMDGKSIKDFFSKRTVSKKTGDDDLKMDTSNTTADIVEQQVQSRQEIIDTKQETPFLSLCELFDRIEGTTKRLEITEMLTGFFHGLMRAGNAKDLVATCLLSLSRLGPEYEGLEMGLGEALLLKALANSTGRTIPSLKTDLEAQGDIGMVAEGSRAQQRTMFPTRPLTLTGLLKSLRDVAKASGQSATGQRVAKVQGLLAACSPKEARFLFRLLAGKLRIGLAEQSVLIALGEAAHAYHRLPNTQQNIINPGEIVKSVFHTLPNYELIIPNLLAHRLEDLPSYCHMTPGVPVKPMLAFPTKSMTEVLDRFDGVPFTCEYKYDGERAQIHYTPDRQFFIFSRNMENMTGKYPDILQMILPECVLGTAESFVLDCEVVAVDPNDHSKLLPFQILSTRKRKDVSVESVQVQVAVFAFDLIYLNGRQLLKTPLQDRRALMYKHFKETDRFKFAKHLDSDSLDEMQVFLDEAIKGGCEGLMVKVSSGEESSYEPSRRSRNWLKVKKDYLESAGGDTLDLVVIGAYWGRGKRTGGFGGFLLGCYDGDTEDIQAVCKLGTGFSEEQLDTFTQELKPDIINTKPTYVKASNAPDVWLMPKQVWEVKAADFSLSPVYPAGQGLIDKDRGISLRFPRFIRKREDKTPETSSSPELLSELYRQQASVTKPNLDYDEDY